ncbi:hypothetical protein F4604DRAFT_1685902 [Suillus subluteus]|nr:hypothetical protein F4604DRAFT_1685902 [Suillus subluteus]
MAAESVWEINKNLSPFAPYTTVMPRPNKAAAQARAKRWAGQSMFVPAKAVSDSGESMYDSGEEEVWSAAESDAEERDDSPENIVSLQKLYAVFLPPRLKQHNVPQAKKRQGPNRSVIYQKDSHTSNWWKKNYWKGASKGCQKLDSFFSKKRTRTPSPDLQLMSESEMMDETLEEDFGLAFDIEMGLEFDPQLHMPDNETNNDFWLQVAHNDGEEELDYDESKSVIDSEAQVTEAPEITAAREPIDEDEDEPAPDIFQIVKLCLEDLES